MPPLDSAPASPLQSPSLTDAQVRLWRASLVKLHWQLQLYPQSPGPGLHSRSCAPTKQPCRRAGSQLRRRRGSPNSVMRAAVAVLLYAPRLEVPDYSEAWTAGGEPGAAQTAALASRSRGPSRPKTGAAQRRILWSWEEHAQACLLLPHCLSPLRLLSLRLLSLRLLSLRLQPFRLLQPRSSPALSIVFAISLVLALLYQLAQIAAAVPVP